MIHRNFFPALLAFSVVFAISGCVAFTGDLGSAESSPHVVRSSEPTNATNSSSAIDSLEKIQVKGRAPKTGYARSEFGSAWIDTNTAPWGGNSLSTREDILSRDLHEITCKSRPPKSAPACVVQSGILNDPYTGQTIKFVRGQKTSSLVPIDHVVSLSDAWQKGAQQLTAVQRVNFANDPLNLIATVRSANSTKGDSDAASWLVPDKSFRCIYVARQIAVKAIYNLWVTKAEKAAISAVLAKCPDQKVPTSSDALTRTLNPEF